MFLETKDSASGSGGEGMSPDNIQKCENCQTYGMTSEFLTGGRFCSKVCVAQHASKYV